MRRRKKIKPQGFRKIVARIDADQHQRLSEIRDTFGFKSNYEIVQYLVACFLRTVSPNPDNDADAEPVPDEIAAMFYDFSEADRKFDFVRPKRRLPQYKLDEINGQLRLWQE